MSNAVLALIGVLGSAAIAGIVTLVSHFSAGAQPPQLTRKEQLEAREKYAKYIEVLRRELNNFRTTYFGDYAKLKADGIVPDKAKQQLCDGLRQRVHDAGLLETYTAMQAAFPDLIFKGADWKKIIADGRQLFTEFIDAIHNAAESQIDSSTDKAINDLQGSILGRHFEISQACQELLVK